MGATIIHCGFRQFASLVRPRWCDATEPDASAPRIGCHQRAGITVASLLSWRSERSAAPHDSQNRPGPESERSGARGTKRCCAGPSRAVELGNAERVCEPSAVDLPRGRSPKRVFLGADGPTLHVLLKSRGYRTGRRAKWNGCLAKRRLQNLQRTKPLLDHPQ